MYYTNSVLIKQCIGNRSTTLLSYVLEMTTFVCRLIFCAKVTDTENILRLFDNVINKNFAQRITGLLLIYPDYVIHLIEAFEDDLFRLCREVITINSVIMTNIKCLYVQNDAKKRFFEQWYFRRMNDDNLKNDDKLEKLEDNFQNASSIYKAIITNLFTLYIELWNTWRLTNHENFIELLNLISVKGHLNIPSKKDVEFVLQSGWGHSLETLVNQYFNFTYASNFDDYSIVSEIIQEIDYNYEECIKNDEQCQSNGYLHI